MRSGKGLRLLAVLSLALALSLAGCNTIGATNPPSVTSPTARLPAAPSPAPAKASQPAPPATPSAQRPISIGEPRAQQIVRSPVHVSGLASVFEATVSLEVVDAHGAVVGKGFTTASAGAPEVGTYAADITFTQPPRDEVGLVRAFSVSPKDGSRIGVVEVPVTLGGSGNGAPQTMLLQAFFTQSTANDIEFVPVARTVPYTKAAGQAALAELLKGPTEDEKRQGLATSIPAAAQLRSLRIENGTAYADFDEKLGEGVGGSVRTMAIVRQINLTLGQFSTVQKVVISIDGRSEGILQP